MEKIEYMEKDYPNHPTTYDLNELGKDGWRVWKMKKYARDGVVSSWKPLTEEDTYWTVYAMRII